MKHQLRALVLTIACAILFYNSKAQWVSIPDTSFGTFLKANYPTCMQGNSTVGWQMDTTCGSIVNAKGVTCSNKPHLTNLTGIQYFDNLDSLICWSDSITFIPAFPPKLKYLNTWGNQLSSFPALPDSVRYFDCTANYPLTALPVLPPLLNWLYCLGCPVTALPALPNSLIEIDCRGCSISSLPALPNALVSLYCGSAQLLSLPSLPASLKTLACEYSNVTVIPALPNGLNKLIFRGSNLTSLPTLPASLTELWTFDNQLTTLPTLPAGLKLLWCNGNKLTALPAIPATVCGIDCHANLLSALPSLPDSLGTFHIYDNPGITCLPHLGKVNFFKYYNTGITCLPNYPQASIQSDPPLNFTPLCDTFNSNACNVLWNIAGNVYYDANNNCIKNPTDTAQGNIKVQLWNSGTLVQQAYTGNEGFYTFDVNTYGNYDITADTTTAPFVVSCPVSNLLHDTITALDSMDYGKDFALQCGTGFDLTAQCIWGFPFRPANFTTVTIHAGDITNFYGVHCAAGVSGTVIITINGSAHYTAPAAGALTPTTVSGNTLTYAVANFGTVNFFNAFDIVVQTDTTTPIGSQICITVSVTPTVGDNNPANNVLTHCFTVVASYDPNDKTAYPAGNIDTAQKELTYTIRFQNTGTAEAQHIYITDTLDTDVDASSFQLLAYSHQPMVQLKENAVRFNFPNINLPDSNTNEPLSHGYVQYKVKLKPNLPIGTVINNTAYIYFDFNAPVVTNTTTNTISINTGIQAVSHQPLAFRIFPNPSNGNVTISVDESLVGSTAIVSDVMGRVVFKSEITNPKSEINVAGFGAGVYFVTLGGGTQKLIIHH